MTGSRALRRDPRHSRGPARSRAVIAASMLLVLAALGRSAQPTSAAWSDGAYFAASASSGSWTAPDSCQVRNADGTVDPTKPCTVTVTDGGSYHSFLWFSWGTFAFSLSASRQPSATQYFTFSVTIPQAPPGGWSSGQWVTTGLGSTVVTSSCSSLPLVAGRTPSNPGQTDAISGTLQPAGLFVTPACQP